MDKKLRRKAYFEANAVCTDVVHETVGQERNVTIICTQMSRYREAIEDCSGDSCEKKLSRKSARKIFL